MFSDFTEGEEVNKNNHTVNTAKILRKSSTRRPSCSQISESLYSTLNKHSARNIMPTSTMETHTIPSKWFMPLMLSGAPAIFRSSYFIFPVNVFMLSMLGGGIKPTVF